MCFVSVVSKGFCIQLLYLSYGSVPHTKSGLALSITCGMLFIVPSHYIMRLAYINFNYYLDTGDNINLMVSDLRLSHVY